MSNKQANELTPEQLKNISAGGGGNTELGPYPSTAGGYWDCAYYISLTGDGEYVPGSPPACDCSFQDSSNQICQNCPVK